MHISHVYGLSCLLGLSLLGAELGAESIPVTVTAYTWSGLRTASGKWPTPGMLAISRDLEHDYTLHFGQQLTLLGLGTYRFECRMHRRWTRRVDIYLPTSHQARLFGIRRTRLVVPQTRQAVPETRQGTT